MLSKSSKFLFVLMFFFLFISLIEAQKNPMRYRRVDASYFDMTSYKADTTAKAVILGDYGSVEIKHNRNRGFESHFTRHLRVKIFDKDAFDLANFKIPIRSSGSEKERLTNLKGITYTQESGKVTRTRLDRSSRYEEILSDYLTNVNFTMPNIREGSVFEIEYTITSPFLYSLPAWYFQNDYPTIFSKFSTSIPEYFTYKPLMQGFLILDNIETESRKRQLQVEWTEESFGGQQQRYTQKVDYYDNIITYRVDNAPAFNTEPYMNSPINYLSKIEHEIVLFRMPQGRIHDYSSTWAQLSKQLIESESFGKQLQRSGFLSDEIQNLKASYSDPNERMIAAYELIQNEMTWNKLNSLYVNQTLRRAWSNKQGNSADINLMLVMLLNQLDIEAYPVILSTRNNGMINPVQIMLDKFNYVIAQASIGEEIFLMDATNKKTPYYLLPERCLNGQARLISENQSKWVNLGIIGDNNTISNSNINVEPCGSIHTELTRHKTNHMHLKMINNFEKFNSEDDYIDYFESNNTGIELTSFDIENYSDWSNPLTTTYNFKIQEPDNSAKNVIYVNPLLIDQMETNPFRLDNRQFPVDFVMPHKYEYSIIVETPEGYVIEELPGNIDLKLPQQGGSYTSRYIAKNDNVIEVNVVFDISKALFLPNEYNDLKEFFAKVVEHQAQSIVLKKL